MNEVSRFSLQPVNLLRSEDPNLIESNKLQIQREKINQFIQANYRVYISNVDQLDEAQIICLGESHGNETHRKINAQIVDMLYENESILLVEKSSQEINEESSLLCEDELINDQAKYVKKPIKIQGWDVEYNENSIKELKEFVTASMIYEKPRASYFLSPFRINRISNDLENNQLSTCSRITSLFSFCCILCCTSLFVKCCTPCIKKYYKKKGYQGFQKIINEVPIRNQKMCETIQNVSETNKKIFIMAGSNHFDFVGQGLEGIDYGPSNNAVEQTVDFLAAKKFAILIPNENDFNEFER